MLLLFFSLSACAQKSELDILLSTLLSHSVPTFNIPAEEVRFDNFLILDSRSFGEYSVSHIEDAYWVGYDEFDLVNLPEISKDDTLLVYCSVGYRSEKIAERIKDAGYPNVFNLYGGIFEWKNQGLDIVNVNGKTDSIHAYNRIWKRYSKSGISVY